MINLKSAATLLIKHKSIAPLSGLSNEMICILVTQGVAKRLKIKIRGPTKLACMSPYSTFYNVNLGARGWASNFFQTYNHDLVPVVLQLLKLQGCIATHLKVLLVVQLNFLVMFFISKSPYSATYI